MRLRRSSCSYFAMPLAVLSLAACQRSQPEASQAAPAAANGAAGQGAPAVTVKRDNPCSVLLPGEVESIVGAPVTMREVVDEVTCSFPFDKPPKAAAAPSKGRGGDDARDAENMAKEMASGFAGGPAQLIMKVYFKDGRTTIAANRMAASLLGSFEKLEGIGDEAWLGPMASTLVFRKGDVGVELDLRMIPDGRERGIRLAKLIASRL